MLPILFPLQSLFGNCLILACTQTVSALKSVQRLLAIVRNGLHGYYPLPSALNHNLG
jgi:hypothetical protein